MECDNDDAICQTLCTRLEDLHEFRPGYVNGELYLIHDSYSEKIDVTQQQ